MKTTTALALGSNQKNKSRSMMIIAAIVLSTMLLTAITVYAFGIIKLNRFSAEATYGSYYGKFLFVTPQQMEKLQHRSEFTDIGRYASSGFIDSRYDMGLEYADENTQRLGNIVNTIETGRYPQAANEIMATPEMLDKLGYRGAEVGDTIKINYRADEKTPFREIELKISGIQKAPETASEKSFCGFVSQKFFESYFDKDTYRFNVMFRLNDSIQINGDNAKETIEALADKCGIKSYQIDVNTMYIILALEPGTEIIAVCAALALCVVFFSMIVIYNIFQVSFVQKMQEYGRIKAIGATGRQMKSLISKEGMMLAAPAVPVGVGVGYILAHFTFFWVTEHSAGMAAMNTDGFSLFSPVTLLISGALGFLTVWLALIRSKRMIKKLSAVEAVNFRENVKSAKSGFRKGKKNVTEAGLVAANIKAFKKTTITTVLTMGLSCVMFVTMANCVGNIDAGYEARKELPHGQFQIGLDYSLYDEAYPENNLDNILKNNPIADIAGEIKQSDGVTDIQMQNLLMMQMGDAKSDVQIMEREDFEQEVAQGSTIGELDYDRISREGGIVYGWSSFMEEAGIKEGDRISFSLWNGSEWKKCSAVVAGSFGSTRCNWTITADTYRSLGFKSESPGVLWIDCDQKETAKLTETIRKAADREHVELDTYEEVLKESEFSTGTVRAGIYILLAVIGLIGFMNLANTMVISVTARKREYGILQAVGMTDRQLNRLLTMQGLIFTAGTLAVSLGIGIPAGYAVFSYCKAHSYFGMNMYHFPAVEVAVMAAVLVIMQLALSYILSRNVKKESPVDRIRYSS